MPAGFDVFIVLAVVAGGRTGAQARAMFSPLDDTMQYELQYEPTDASAPTQPRRQHNRPVVRVDDP